MRSSKVKQHALSVNDRIEWLEVRDVRRAAEKVCRDHHVTLRDILGKSRASHVVRARHAVWALCRGDGYGWSYPSIAEAFGVDHTTVMAALKGLSL